jgi:hypothetical protein
MSVFLKPIDDIPHGEERPGAAGTRLEAHTTGGAAHSCPASVAADPRLQTAPAPCIIRHRFGFATWSWTMTILVTGSTGTIESQVVAEARRTRGTNPRARSRRRLQCQTPRGR